jgi:hypothetical protein
MGLDINCRRLSKTPTENVFYLFDCNYNYTDCGLPKWIKEFEQDFPYDVDDLNEVKNKLGIDCDKYEITGSLYSIDKKLIEYGYPQYYSTDRRNMKLYAVYEPKQGEIGDRKVVDVNDIPQKTITVKGIYFEEVGYQRKGLNLKFYKDYENGIIGQFVTTLSELERYKKEYCTTQEDKDKFQRNIIDKFVEGETIVDFG